jgi:hypothetical protein
MALSINANAVALPDGAALQMRCIAIVCVTLPAIVAGCAFIDLIFGEPGSHYERIDAPFAYSRSFAYSRGRRGQDSPWIGRHSNDLVQSLGEPDMILDGRPKYAEYRDGIPKIMYVYRAMPDNGVPRSTCVGAYVVLTATGEIVDYYCR